ncbi:MAG TPA: response regulator [Candidatus Polarisedimenticolia bacterium]|nr:response regulator [Candidatus Polarisedimenticolia bacterium]
MSGELQAPDSQNIQTKSAQAPRVPLVEKDVVSAETSRKSLEEPGYCVTAAEALTWLHALSETFNCVISGLSMPGIGGLELVNTARLCRPQTPFVLSCSEPGNLPADFLRTLGGISGFLREPSSMDHLSEMLNRALSSDRRF